MMLYLYLVSFLCGLLLGVRLMFFGAERRKRWTGATPLRRSEPAIVAFLFAFGVAGYAFTSRSGLAPATTFGFSALLAVAWAVIVTRLAIVAARIQPEHDPDDPRFMLRGRVALVTVAIPDHGAGTIELQDADVFRAVSARSVDGSAIASGQEVCIERLEDNVAFVELWSLVEQRL